MIVDYLRTCYQVPCQFKADDPTLATIRFYRAPPTAQPFPGVHGFRPLIQCNGLENPGVGEQSGAIRAYDKGVAPTGVLGTNYCGQLHEFTDGIDDWLATPIPINSHGVPTCCASFPCYPIFRTEPTGHYVLNGGPFVNAPSFNPGNNLYRWGADPGPFFGLEVTNTVPCDVCPAPHSTLDIFARQSGIVGRPVLIDYDCPGKLGTLQFGSHPGLWFDNLTVTVKEL
jgi:hypothetical protein